MEEFICDRCNGTGEIEKIVPDSSPPWKSTKLVSMCPKCLGEKKLNWLEMVFGKQASEVRTLKAGWTMNASQDIQALYDVNLHDEIVNELSKQIAEEIDKEIMNAILTGKTTV